MSEVNVKGRENDKDHLDLTNAESANGSEGKTDAHMTAILRIIYVGWER